MHTHFHQRRLAVALALTGVGVAVSGQAQSTVDLRWVSIEPGSYQRGCVTGDAECLGDERPAHAVTLSKPFDLMAREVTVRQYLGFTNATGHPLPPQPNFLQNGDHPIVLVDWNDASAFCSWAGGRLPTEAEWEYAARGGVSDRVYGWGDEFETDRANYNDECCGDVEPGDRWPNTAPVGSFPPNPFGLYDMTGNVWEWVSDWFGAYPDTAVVDPAGAETGLLRIARGGSWFNPPTILRLSVRLMFDPAGRTGNVGVRCARDTVTTITAE